MTKIPRKLKVVLLLFILGLTVVPLLLSIIYDYFAHSWLFGFYFAETSALFQLMTWVLPVLFLVFLASRYFGGVREWGFGISVSKAPLTIAVGVEASLFVAVLLIEPTNYALGIIQALSMLIFIVLFSRTCIKAWGQITTNRRALAVAGIAIILGVVEPTTSILAGVAHATALSAAVSLATIIGWFGYFTLTFVLTNNIPRLIVEQLHDS